MKEYDDEKKSDEDLEDSQEDSKSFSEEVIDVLAALDDLVARAKSNSYAPWRRWEKIRR